MIRIRPARSEDAGLLLAVMERAFEPKYGEAWNGAQLVAALESPIGFAALAEQSGEPAGFGLARVIADEAELLLVAVKPEKRRSGIGSALINMVAETARQRGGASLFLEVRDGNDAAVQLYKTQGFSEVGRRPAYYAGANQARFDAITMRKTLQSGKE